MSFSRETATSEPVVLDLCIIAVDSAAMAAPAAFEYETSADKCPSSAYSSFSTEREFHHPLIATKAKESCDEREDVRSPQDTLQNVFGGDLEKEVEAVDEEEKSDLEEQKGGGG